MSVTTISRQLGSLGTEIAQAAANRLNYQYVDKEKIEKPWLIVVHRKLK